MDSQVFLGMNAHAQYKAILHNQQLYIKDCEGLVVVARW